MIDHDLGWDTPNEFNSYEEAVLYAIDKYFDRFSIKKVYVRI